MSLLRQRGQADSGKVGMVELFFDLVFVFAVTQLSHTLLKKLDAQGALQVGLLFMATWWVWIYTVWATNWFDPEKKTVRAALFALLVAGLLMSVSIPRAFTDLGWLFGASIMLQQVGRTLAMLAASRGDDAALRCNFVRITCWLTASGSLWMAGGFADAEARMAWWLAALAVDMMGPVMFYFVPGLGRSTLADWNVDGSHMAERCALFVIIALGESLLVTGATFAELAFDPATVLAFLLAVVGSILMWWLYFDHGLEQGHHRIVHSETPGRHARNNYTYLHILIVAGIIVGAVGDELVLSHPHHGSPAALAAIIGGPLLFLCGTAVFKWLAHTRAWPPLSHLLGIALLLVLGALSIGLHLSPLLASGACVAVLLLVAVWESCVLR
ncbi:Low temperature requirement protein LtrA [Duganella sp. CF458]|uniref:low temperature requirement protein A n=1 Tax=Duganella sp. CF458 TaxID=1884368 RepID=UPI0008DF7912|nr:low temperature requirement protein A [Duganella sp. CF458]SFG19128.1 Low temperature requirement protein LtrA [Duganella sp. CF458]